LVIYFFVPVLIMKIQPYHFWIFNLLILSLLLGWFQQKKTATNAAVLPNDQGNQLPKNILRLPTFGFPTSSQPNVGKQLGSQLPVNKPLDSQNPQVPLAYPSIQPSMESQSPENAQKNWPNLAPPTESSQLTPPNDFLLQPEKDKDDPDQKSSPLIVESPQVVSLSEPNANLLQTQQPQAKNLLSNQISLSPSNSAALLLSRASNNTLYLSLKEAFARADAKNPQLLAAQQNIKISEAGITIAGARPNPQINFQYGFGPIYSDAGNPQQLGLDQTVELGGKRSKRLSVARSQYQLSILQYNAARLDLRDQVRRAYAELAAAQASDRSQKEQVQLLEKLLYIARKRFEAGAAPEADVLQARLILNQTEPILEQSKGRIAQAVVQLNALMGDSPTQKIEITDPGVFNVGVKNTELVPLPNQQLPSIDTLIAKANEQRLDFQSTKQQTDIAKKQLKLAQVMRVPDLQLSGGYLFTTADAPNPNNSGYYVGAAVNWPLFYQQKGEIAQAKSTLDQSVQQENVVRAQIAVDVRTAYEALIIARDKIRKYQSRLLSDSREVLALAQESYQVGKTDLVSVVTVEQSDQQNRSAYVDAVTDYQNAYADLEKALGAPLSLASK